MVNFLILYCRKRQVPISKCHTCFRKMLLHYFRKSAYYSWLSLIYRVVLYCYELAYNKMVTEVAELLQYRLSGQSNRNTFKVYQESFLKPSAGFCATGAVWLCIVWMWYSPFCYLGAFSLSVLLFSSLRKSTFSYLPTFNITWLFCSFRFAAVAILAASNGYGSSSSTNSSATSSSAYRQPVKK